MRPLAMLGSSITLALAATFFFATEALADDSCGVGAGSSAGGMGSSVIVRGECRVDHTPTGDTTPVVNPGGPAPVWAFEPFWGTHPDTGEECLDLVESSTVTVNDPIALAWEARMLQMLYDPRLDTVEHRWCDASSNLLIEDPTPQVREFVRSIALPRPELWVAPGFAVTGMEAYLEVDGQDPFEVTTTIDGFGGLEVELSPTVLLVDWGDGVSERVDDGRRGAPWDGPEHEQIEHLYLHPDEDLRLEVTARWMARWSVGAFSGVVDDLATTETLELPVQTHRALRTHDLGQS